MNTNPNNGGFSYKGKENYLQVNTEDSSRIEGRYSPVQNCINTGSFFFLRLADLLSSQRL